MLKFSDNLKNKGSDSQGKEETVKRFVLEYKEKHFEFYPKNGTIQYKNVISPARGGYDFPDGFFEKKDYIMTESEKLKCNELISELIQNTTLASKLEPLPPGALRDEYSRIEYSSGATFYYTNTFVDSSGFTVKKQPSNLHFFNLYEYMMKFKDFKNLGRSDNRLNTNYDVRKMSRVWFQCPNCGASFERYGETLGDITFGTCGSCGYSIDDDVALNQEGSLESKPKKEQKIIRRTGFGLLVAGVCIVPVGLINSLLMGVAGFLAGCGLILVLRSYFHRKYLNASKEKLGEDKECISGMHELIAHGTHEVSCVGTPVSIDYYECRKCGKKIWLWECLDGVEKYGTVVEKKIRTKLASTCYGPNELAEDIEHKFRDVSYEGGHGGVCDSE